MQNYLEELRAVIHRFYGRVPDGFKLDRLKGDASTRSYYRLGIDERIHASEFSELPVSIIIMRLPKGEVQSDEIVHRETSLEYPFINVQRLLKKRGIRVPGIYLDQSDRGFVILEDLGEETFETRLHKWGKPHWSNLYKKAIDLLVELQNNCELPDSACVAYQRKFDSELLLWELNHFLEFGLTEIRGSLSDEQRVEINQIFSQLVALLEEIPKGFVHRDFQSRNLMWVPRSKGGDLAVIDFQDALIGPYFYDLAALLCDSYFPLDIDLQDEMLEYYLSKRQFSQPVASDFHKAFWQIVLHRKLKDAGRFVYIDRVRKNPHFLPYFSQSLRYVGRALDRLDGFFGLDRLLTHLLPGFADNVIEPRSLHTSK